MRPAPPKHSAYSDQRKAAPTPTETSVSMVAAACRALTAAARWNGQAPQVTTGTASASETHCQDGNGAAGTIASTMTGTASASDTASRRRGALVRPSVSASLPAAPAAPAEGGA